MNLFNRLLPEQKGVIFISIGLIILAYMFGIFSNALAPLVILSAVFLIMYGIFIGKYWQIFTSIKKD